MHAVGGRAGDRASGHGNGQDTRVNICKQTSVTRSCWCKERNLGAAVFSAISFDVEVERAGAIVDKPKLQIKAEGPQSRVRTRSLGGRHVLSCAQLGDDSARQLIVK